MNLNMGINMRQSQYAHAQNDQQQSQWSGGQNPNYPGAGSQQMNQSLVSSSQHTGGGGASQGQNFKVIIRVRPPLQREKVHGCQFRSIVQVGANNKSCAIMEYLGAEVTEKERQKDMDLNPHLCVWQNFTFDFVYDQHATQEFVYENTAKQSVVSVLEGYNSTVIAYGQTGTGKTHTMEGFKYNVGDPQRGIIPRSMEEIFKFIQMQSSKNSTFMVRVSYLQIYNEIISDLLKVERTSLQIREDKKKGVFVEGLSEWAVRSPNEVYSLMQKGAQCRATATTKMNDLSSRSHAVFIIIVEQMTIMNKPDNHKEDAPKQIKVGKLNLVDLAGSERVRVTQATGQRLEESKKINQSLSALGNVIAALTDLKARPHIPYRDSKLTRILEDSLGGNCKTTMMAMISPSADAFGESQSTLKFATRAKKIKNEARINEDIDQRTLLRKYEIELRRLKQELDTRSANVHGHEQIMQLEKEKRRAEEDKNAAITALEMRSREFMQEKEQKKLLEQKITAMNSQLLVGGKKVEDTPQFRNALEERQRMIRKEYDEKMQEIEKERIQIEEDKQQVDRYKQLLLKQRDIMIALTSRLNERDETIIQLQEELEAYDRINRDTEQCMELKNYRIEQLQSFIKNECSREIPPNQMGINGQEDYLIRHFASYQERKYQPHHEWIGQNQNLPLQLLTSEEKIQELNQILEAKSLENDEMRVQMESDQGSGAGQAPGKNVDLDGLQAQNQKNNQNLQEILWLVNSACNDLNSMQQNPHLITQMVGQKLQSIGQVANRVQFDDFEALPAKQHLSQYPRPESSQSGQTIQNPNNVSKISGISQLVAPMQQHERLGAQQPRPTSGQIPSRSTQGGQYNGNKPSMSLSQSSSNAQQQQYNQTSTSSGGYRGQDAQSSTKSSGTANGQMPDSVSEMLRKRQMQKMKSGGNEGQPHRKNR